MSAAITYVPTSRVSLSAISLPGFAGFIFAARETFTYLFFTSNPELGSQFTFAVSMALLLGAAFASYGPSTTSISTRPFRWPLAFLAFSLLSLAWTEAVSLPISIAYWLGMASDTAIVLLLLRISTLRNLTQKLLGGYVCGVCFIAIVMWLSPTMQDLRPGNDEFFSPNAIGFALGFGCFLAQYLLRTHRAWKWPAIFLAISLLRSLSKATIAAFIIGQLIVLARDTSRPSASKRNILLASTAVLIAFSSLLSRYYAVYLNAGNQAITLTGRIGIWAFVLTRSFDRPWLGHGFNSFRHVIPAFGSFETWHAHNELIQQFYLYGIAGIILLLGIYISLYRHVRRLHAAAIRPLFTGLLAFVIVRGLADSERFDLSLPIWSITILSLVLSSEAAPIEALP